MSDDILARCDMVLAISEDTINYQFQQLWKRQVIRKDWKVLVRQTKDQNGNPVYEVKTEEDADFDQALSTWVSTQQQLATLFANGEYKEYGQQLADAKQKGLLYDYGWSASIDAPTITILKSSASSLLFKVSFDSGTLYNSHDLISALDAYDLKGCVYAFDVPVGRIDIDGTQELLTSDSQQQAATVIRDSGLTDADFTIEGLLLDFENANISNFDEANSKFPAQMADALQTTVEDYFKLVVAKGKNPYILGYAVKVRPQSAAKAIFQPTEARFSTSYSDRKGRSAFNFLLMTGGRPFPAGQNTGILPQSLLEAAGYDPTLDGLFAIDYGIFDGLLLEPFVGAINQTITTGFGHAPYTRDGQKWTLSDSASSQTNVDDPPSDFGKNTHMNTSTALDSSIRLTAGASGNLLFQCTFDYSVDIEIRPWAMFHGFKYYTAYEYWLSTRGQYQAGPSGDKGRGGYVEMSIEPGAEGRVDFQIASVVTPALGYDKAPYEQSDGDGTPETMLIDAYNKLDSERDAASAAVKASQQIGDTVGGVKSDIQNVINSLSTGKVVLPLGEIYTFKSIRLHDAANTDNNAVLLNVSYAPVTH